MRYISIVFFLVLQMTLLKAQNMGVRLPVATLPNTTLDVNGSTAFREGTALALSDGVNSDVALGDYSLFRITGPTAAFSITGFQSGQNGRVLTIINATTQVLTLIHQTTSVSLANNQINTGGNALSLAANGVATLIYSSTLTKWVVTGGQGFTNNWGLLGNTGTTAGTNFIGTTDAQDLVLKVNNTEGGRLSSTGFDVANHLSVGSSGIINTYRTVQISENYAEVPTQTTIGLRVSKIRTETSPTSSSLAYGIDAALTYRMSGNSSTGEGSGVKGSINSDGNYGFNSLQGGNFSGTTTASSATQRQLIGAYGYGANAGTGTVAQVSGTYGDATISGGGIITESAGARGWSYLNGSGTITTAIGFKGGSTTSTALGTITTGIGAWLESSNAATNYGVLGTATVNLSGTYANTYGASFNAYSNHASATLTNAYGVNASVNKVLGTITNSYAGYFSALDGSTTNYGVYSNVGSSATNNYAFYGNVASGASTDWGLYLTGEDKNYMSGKFGIGTPAPANKLDVEGAAVVGATYSGTNTAPTNGLLVEGNTSIGTASPLSTARLHVENTGSNYAVNAPTSTNLNYFAGNTAFGGYSSNPNDISLLWGATAVDNAISLQKDFTSFTAGTLYRGLSTVLRLSPSSNISNLIHGVTNDIQTNASSTGNFTSLIRAVGADFRHYGSGTVSEVEGLNAHVGNYGTGIITDAYGVQAHVFRSTGTITNSYGGQFLAWGGSTANYGLYSNPANSAINNYMYYGTMTAAGNTDWGIYLTGEDKNYFSGIVSIGTTSVAHKLNVTGTAGLSTGTTWTNTSDRRVKENIHPYQRGLKEILAIDPVFYTYKASLGIGNGAENIGIIAQDVEKILPEAIMTAPITLKDGSVIQDGKHLYRADAIWFAMINAFKELNAENEKLKAENEALKKSVEKNSKDIESLKAMFQKKQN